MATIKFPDVDKLNNFAATIFDFKSLQALTEGVLNIFGDTFGTPNMELWYFLGPTRKVRCHDATGLCEPMPTAILSIDEYPPAQHAFTRREALLMTEFCKADTALCRRATALNATELFIIPLVAGDDAYGFINIWCSEDTIHPTTQNVLQTAGYFIGLALEHLGNQRRKSMLELEVRAIQTVSKTLSGLASLESVFDLILQATLSLTDTDDASNAHIFLCDGENIIFGAALWKDGSRDTPFQTVRPNGLTASVAASGEIIAVPNIRAHPLFGDTYDFNADGAIIGVPLKIGERVVGVMNVAYNKHHPFHILEVEALKVLAAQAAIVIENARLFDRAQAELIERRRIEESLRAEEVKYRALVENSADAIYLLCGDRYEFINPSFEKMFGVTLDELNNPNFDVYREIIAERGRDKLMAEVEKRKQGIPMLPQLELTGRNAKTGKEFDVELSRTEFIYNGKHTIHGIIRDVSERKKLEEQLQYAQRMEAVGELAGGIAHNFNNILTAITALSSLAMSEVPPQSNLHGDLRIIREQANRAASLVKEMLYFSRRKPLDVHPLNVNDFIRSSRRFLQQFLGVEISINLTLTDEPAFIHADGGALEQILANITLNARDAMPDGGVMTIATAVESFASTAASHPEMNDGQYVRLSISDIGLGIEPENLPRIFEPFYTTKLPNYNSGLGLALVFGLVKQLHGFVQAESQLNRGTTINMYFPALKPAETSESIPHPPKSLSGGHEHILILDGEDSTRKVVRRVLENVGYSVADKATGTAGLAYLKGAASPVDMVISCLQLPDMTAAALFQAILSEPLPQENLPQFIFTSSRTRDEAETVLPPEMLQIYPLLKKPYSPVLLTETIRKMLETA